MHDETHGALVLGDQGELLGTLTKADIEQVPERQREQRTVGEVMTRQVQALHEASPLDAALEKLTTRQVSWAPVIASGDGTGEHHAVGVLTLSQIVQVYQQAKVEIYTRASETQNTCL